MSRRKRINAVDEAHARRLCLQGRGPVYLDGVEYEFRLVPDGQSADQTLEDLRDAQASVPVEDQVERVVEPRRPSRKDASAVIRDFLASCFPDVLEEGFHLEPDGDDSAAQGKCGWAFWVYPEDTTSYVHEDLTIEYYGPTEKRVVGDQLLWDEHGTSTEPHKACPQRESSEEGGSHFDAAWCCECGWAGSLTEMREERERDLSEDPDYSRLDRTLRHEIVSWIRNPGQGRAQIEDKLAAAIERAPLCWAARWAVLLDLVRDATRMPCLTAELRAVKETARGWDVLRRLSAGSERVENLEEIRALRDAGLVDVVPFKGRVRYAVLTPRGRDLLALIG